ncbi:CDP-glycerol glycerophosphotransferase family protein [Shewanella sp. 1_MG-2023]|uniref:CDP-glycerol glycerophosphotransferase family protein n=1 Tax=unclassified Shewanella TaxID=196818 RepID=UPI0026E26E16|nr:MULTISPECIES: CDP-glycerol glycerophosphotransferase family protein [unclassified Shewanella]MDO6610240.1 CDP-glycerol glycerophosphotransferase family protein [Shewanella sp. 7_MG-2023]MDO6769618.1 CDP-glycerol glycerophosphotransferase family protein [Shewanella sp. 2_MG-2023]MDO6792682.1 CDP-glycerol glycerophosphotransferase family protein [Shewanella sp. 1_MG-2023]
MSQFIVNCIRYIVTQSLYFIGGFCPRSRKAVMGCYKNKFADNSKYLFLHWQQALAIRAIWISGDKVLVNQLVEQGYEAYTRWSFKGIYHALTAKYYVYNSYIGDINQYFARGAIKINLWHGSPLKRIEFDINNGPLFKVYHPQTLHDKFISAAQYHQQKVRPDHMIAPSELVSTLFASAFRIEQQQMLLCGNPRTDYYKRYPSNIDTHNQSKTSVIEELKQINQVKQVLLYAPSWRDSSALSNPSHSEVAHNPYTKAINFEALSASLVSNEQLLLLRLHPNEANLADDIKNYPNILNISDWQDTYEIINDVDLLITDYSSLYIDMLQTKANIVFFQFDQQQYQTDSRQCYPYADEIPMAGEVLIDNLQLADYLQNLSQNQNITSLTNKKNRAELTQLYWQYQHNESFIELDKLVNA